jgi:D-alanine-D-alanine ligase
MASTRFAGTSDRLRLGIIFGGTGPEHEASLSSARAVIDGLDSHTYQIEQFGIAKSGEWLVGPSAWEELLTAADPSLLPTAIRSRLDAPRDTSARAEVLPVPDLLRLSSLDCLFPIVHGVGGEDGSLQGTLMQTGRPIVGSPLLATAQGYNKWATKRLARDAGVPVAKGLIVGQQTSRSDLRVMIEATFGHWDLFVKPVSCGSSFGVSRIRSEGEVDQALETAFAYDRNVLIEEYIEHTEIFVGIVEEKGDLLIAPSASERPGKLGFSTYNDKYIATEEAVRCPSVLSPDLDRRVRQLAGKVFEALGCAGLARVDFFLSSRDGGLIFNEINTMPAMARDCAFPTGMQRTGMTYPQLLDKIVSHALEIKPERRALEPSTARHDDADRSPIEVALLEKIPLSA